MAQKPDGKPAGAERVTFTRPAADRIAKVVRRVEQGNRDAGPLRFDRIGSGGQFRLSVATFTGDWATGAWKTVTLTGSTQTASVYNWCTPVVGGPAADTSCSRYVVFGKASGTNSAVEIQMQATCDTCVMSFAGVDLRQIAGYSEGVIQLLGHDTTGPCLQWYSVITCSTATAS